MKLSEQEKEWILRAIKDFDAEFGPLGRVPPVDGFSDWVREIRFALQDIDKGIMPRHPKPLFAVAQALEWSAKNSPQHHGDFSDFVAAIQEYTVHTEFEE